MLVCSSCCTVCSVCCMLVDMKWLSTLLLTGISNFMPVIENYCILFVILQCGLCLIKNLVLKSIKHFKHYMKIEISYVELQCFDRHYQ